MLIMFSIIALKQMIISLCFLFAQFEKGIIIKYFERVFY